MEAVAEAVAELSCTVGDSGESAEFAELLEGLVIDCCIGLRPDELEAEIEAGEVDSASTDDNWQLIVFVQDVCPAKVRGGLGGIGSTWNRKNKSQQL